MIIDIPAQAAAILADRSATPVDLYGFLELLILHELTHTYAGGLSKHYRSAQSGLDGAGFRAAAGVGVNAWNNAETLAFMGLISKLIQLGYSVDHFGELHQIPAEGLAVRSLHNLSRFDMHKSLSRQEDA